MTVMPSPVTVDAIVVGDKVRSFDFVHGPYGRDLTGDRACFVEGRVVDLEKIDGSWRYKILVRKDVFGGENKPHRVGKHVYPPMNGTRMIMSGDDFANCVSLIVPRGAE